MKTSSFPRKTDGLLMETQNASSVSSKCTRTANIVILVHTVKVSVQCAVNKCWIPSSTSKLASTQSYLHYRNLAPYITKLPYPKLPTMDPPPPSFSGRRRSSVIDLGPSTPSSSPAPRKASTWDSTPESSIAAPSASNISGRRSSTTPYTSSLSGSENSDPGSVAGRKASAWDDPVSMSDNRSSVSDIAGRRATAVDRSPWDVFSGNPPAYEDSTWSWRSSIASMTSAGDDPRRVFYVGNINYVFEIQDDQALAIADVEAVMYAYGVEKASILDMVNQLDSQKSGTFYTNSQNKQIILDSSINFSTPYELLSNLRHASKCLENNLLSPLYFAGYIIHALKGLHFLGNEPGFMILGMYSILGILEGSSNRKLTIKDVNTFTKLWKVTNSDELQDLTNIIKDDYNGSISRWGLYNLLYRRDLFGKQRIQVFNIQAQQNPSMFFTLIDKDEDGFLSSDDLRSFAAIFGQSSSNEAIDRVTRKFDMDGDGRISMDDFCGVIRPVLDGMTWEFWLVAILITFEL